VLIANLILYLLVITMADFSLIQINEHDHTRSWVSRPIPSTKDSKIRLYWEPLSNKAFTFLSFTWTLIWNNESMSPLSLCYCNVLQPMVSSTSKVLCIIVSFILVDTFSPSLDLYHFRCSFGWSFHYFSSMCPSTSQCL